MAVGPFLSDLIAKRLAILSGAEKTRSLRIYAELAALLPAGTCVDEINKASLQKYVDKRFADKLKAQSINRELNCIAAMLNTADCYYHELEQWRPPRMPRPKVLGGRRERIWSAQEIKSVLSTLYADCARGEDARAYLARHRVGAVVQFCLLTGLRTGEVAKLRKINIDFHAGKIHLVQSKTGNRKTLGPLPDAAIDILKEFVARSENEFVFFRGQNIPPKFYRILRETFARLGIPYGCEVERGLRLYDARHTATTQMLEDGVSPATVKEWMGWSDSAFLLHYSHATEKSRVKAGRSLERLAGKKVA